MTMDVAACLDPEIAAALAQSPIGSIDFGTFTFETVPQIREAMANMPLVELPPTTTVSREVVVPGVDGPDPTVRVYSPPTESSGRPCIYWIHGGGYLFGSGLDVDARINRWVEDFDCVAVSIEYRLAPEDPYPAPLDDCYAGLLWTARHADELGIDPARIAVVGASAGGGLAAGLAIRARDRGEVTPCFQLLIYPMIDDTNTSGSSHIDGALVWSRAANDLGWSAYLGSRFGTDDIPGEAAAARVADVGGLPPAWIGVGSLDVFRDEDITYAARLLDAGITTELHVYPGACHGFEMMAPAAAVAQACQRDITEALRRALRPASVGASTS
ncbi:MAG TPA: alpha/beta hydrolase [Acidimicrobiia bacterium]|jgi:acetyl esterase/lipase|nr:alpha/beta hydrolase [Acidimicrobiia bacterium]